MSYRTKAYVLAAAVAALFLSSTEAVRPSIARTFAVQDTVVNDTIKVFSPSVDTLRTSPTFGMVQGIVGLPVTLSGAGFKPSLLDTTRLFTLSQTNDAPFFPPTSSVGPVTAPILTLSAIPSFGQSGTYTVHWTMVNDSIPSRTTTATTTVLIHNLVPPTGVQAYYGPLPASLPNRNSTGVVAFLVWDGTPAEADPYSWNGYRVRRTIHGVSPEQWEVAGQFTNQVITIHNGQRVVLTTETSPLCLAQEAPCVPDSFQFTGTGLFFRGFRNNSLGNGKFALDYPPGNPVDACSSCWVFVDVAIVAGFRTDYKVTSISKNNDTDFIETPQDESVAVTIVPGTPPPDNLERVAVVPNPYKGHAEWDPAVGEGRVHFVHVPAGATVRIFTTSAELVRELTMDANSSPGGTTGELAWDLKNGKGEKVVSGIYIYQVETLEGRTRKGHFVIIK
jgi:hypothetical protein